MTQGFPRTLSTSVPNWPATEAVEYHIFFTMKHPLPAARCGLLSEFFVRLLFVTGRNVYRYRSVVANAHLWSRDAGSRTAQEGMIMEWLLSSAAAHDAWSVKRDSATGLV